MNNIDELRREYDIAMARCEENHVLYEMTELDRAESNLKKKIEQDKYYNDEVDTCFPGEKMLTVNGRHVPLSVAQSDPEWIESIKDSKANFGLK